MDQFDSKLRQMPGYLLRRATSAAMPKVNDLLSEFGLRRTSYSSLAVIVAHPGLNQGQLADVLAVERPNIVQIVDQLEQAGLVQRTKSAEDRRAYSLQPTPKGRALEVRVTEALIQQGLRLTQGLSAEDLIHLRRCLEIIEQNADQMEARDVCDLSST